MYLIFFGVFLKKNFTPSVPPYCDGKGADDEVEFVSISLSGIHYQVV